MPSVIFVMADYGHDPTETAIPFKHFAQAGFDISFVTEHGLVPKCDEAMIKGLTQKFLGATASACLAYQDMTQHSSMTKIKSWSDKDFSLTNYDVLFFPGGHEKSVRQVIDSERVHELIREFWPSVNERKCVGAICHGVLSLAKAGVLKDVKTTTLPKVFENAAFYSTRLFLGDYYKTYGYGTESTEDMVRRECNRVEVTNNPAPFVIKDDKVNYFSGRYPADADLLATQLVRMYIK